MSEQLDSTSPKVERDASGKILPGQESLNPKGRPKGSISIKDQVRKFLENNPNEVEEIVKHFVKNNRELMWQMLEGRPQQDVTSDGEAIQPVLVKFLDGREPNNNSNTPGVSETL